jgi:hypothetical protein
VSPDDQGKLEIKVAAVTDEGSRRDLEGLENTSDRHVAQLADSSHE